MFKILILFFPLLLLAISPFESPKPNLFDTKAYEGTKTLLNEKVINNKKIKCRVVCDKKLYKEQQISDAVTYYKNLKK